MAGAMFLTSEETHGFAPGDNRVRVADEDDRRAARLTGKTRRRELRKPRLRLLSAAARLITTARRGTYGSPATGPGPT